MCAVEVNARTVQKGFDLGAFGCEERGSVSESKWFSSS